MIRIRKLVAISVVIGLLLILNTNKSMAYELVCQNVSEENIKYINTTMCDINVDEFNDKTRGISSDEYYNKSNEEKSYYDKNNILFGTHTYRVIDGLQNGFTSINQRIFANYCAYQGMMQSKLVNGNIAFSRNYKNNYTMFPSSNEQTGTDKIYNEILENWRFPVIEKNGEYSINFSEYHLSRDYSFKTFKLHKGERGGFYPFNDCKDDTYNYDDVNMYFTTKLEIPFVMTTNGKIKNMGTSEYTNLYFNIHGGDDIWVYIDDDLVIDLGGVHVKCYGGIDFEKNSVLYNAVYDKSTDDSFSKIDNDIIKGGLSAGKHTLKIFYAQRGAQDNYLEIKYNLRDDIDINAGESEEEENEVIEAADEENKAVEVVEEYTRDENAFEPESSSIDDNSASNISQDVIGKPLKGLKFDEGKQENNIKTIKLSEIKNNPMIIEKNVVKSEVQKINTLTQSTNNKISEIKKLNNIDKIVQDNDNLLKKDSLIKEKDNLINNEDSLKEDPMKITPVKDFGTSFNNLDADLVVVSKKEINNIMLLQAALTLIVVSLQLAILFKK